MGVGARASQEMPVCECVCVCMCVHACVCDIVGPVTLGVCGERGTRTLGPLLSGTRVQAPGSQLTLPIRVVVSLAECVPGAAWVGGSLWRMLACPLCAGSAGRGPAFGLSV